MWAPTSIALCVLATAAQDPRVREGPEPELVEATVADLRAALRARRGDAEDEGSARNKKISALQRAQQIVAPEVIAEVERGFRDGDHEIQAATIQALRWMDHPDALAALHKSATRNRKLEQDEQLYPALLKAIGQHGDPGSIRLLSRNPFSSPFHEAGRARILGLGRIRTRASLEALLGMMKSASARDVERNMGSFRLSLMVLTGTDQGPSAPQWQRWWKANKKGLQVSAQRRELPRPTQRRWTEYWGTYRDYGRTGRREDRGDG